MTAFKHNLPFLKPARKIKGEKGHILDEIINAVN